VIAVDGDTFTADVMKETFDRSSLGSMSVGDRLNLERAATLSSRLGGHLVQGHVDGVGAILSRTPGARWEDVEISLPKKLNRYVVEKGSITVDGISLTVVSVDEESFTVSLIPTTLQLTTLGHKGLGELVNLEVDVVAKYVEKLVSAQKPRESRAEHGEVGM
jgi:riboflavin synthase